MKYHVIQGDCLDVLRRLPANSIDAIVTDPPAGISFMSKGWDGDKGGRKQWIAWLAERMAEALRVLKPGGHALVWALPKTSHWTGTALEEAGFEVRDRLHHVFGSGMPHAKDLSKAIDARLGVAMSERPVIGTYTAGGNAGTSTAEKGGTFGVGVANSPAVVLTRTTGATPQAQARDGWHTGLKPGCEDWWLARKPLEGTLADNALKYGTGALNIGATRVGNDWENDPTRPESWKRSGVSAKPEAEKIAAPPGQGMILDPGGRWPANIVLTHGAGCVQVGTTTTTRNITGMVGGPEAPSNEWGHLHKNRAHIGTASEEIPVWQCEDGCPVKEMDGQSGTLSSRVFGQAAGEKTQTAYGKYAARNIGGYTNSGGASRYFNVFYSPKASRREREAGCDELPIKTGGEITGRVDGSAGLNNPHAGAGRGGGRRNFHPTVKAISLMDWLVRLITPPGGIVLDPFTGSGSTGVAAVRAGFQFLGVELTEEYLPIILARLAHAAAESEAA